jgi:hypothetical protein
MKINNGEMRKLYNKIINISIYVLRISYWLFVSYATLMISYHSFLLPASYVAFMTLNNFTLYEMIVNKLSNDFKGNKLLLMLVCYLMTSDNDSTPKTKGRPKSKKRGKVMNFMKPKKLDFDDVDPKSSDKHVQTSTHPLNNDLPSRSSDNVSLVNLSTKISVVQSDIINVKKCESIVNAANQKLIGGGGIDGFISQKSRSCIATKMSSFTNQRKR